MPYYHTFPHYFEIYYLKAARNFGVRVLVCFQVLYFWNWYYINYSLLHTPLITVTKQNTDLPADLPSEQEEKLRELTTQSWNLELVISGLALFAVLQLPQVLDELFGYIRYNMLAQTEGLPGLFPVLALSMMKAGCYVLFAAFLTNFVMRAFWVGLVGLLAVYPKGIDYHKIPFTTPYAQDRIKKDLGSLQGYILRLDRHCNIVFAVAFLFVFMLIILAFCYVVVLLLYSGFQPLIPARYWQAIKMTSLVLLAILLVTTFVLAIPQVREKPGMARLHYRIITFNKVITWGMYRPLSYITNTFYSNLPYRKLLKSMLVMSAVFFALIVAELLTDLSRMDHRLSFTNGRHLYSARLDSLFIDPSAYDNQRVEGQYITQAAIQADVIREPFIRLYIAYPKALDTLLTRLSLEPALNNDLLIKERRRMHAEWSHKELNRLVVIYINDSLYHNPDLMYTQFGQQQQRGYQTVLIPTNLKTGKNMIRIGIKADSLGKEYKIASIPFWFVAEN